MAPDRYAQKHVMRFMFCMLTLLVGCARAGQTPARPSRSTIWPPCPAAFQEVSMCFQLRVGLLGCDFLSGTWRSNAAFAKMIGQQIPDTWRGGVHYHNVEENRFSPNEVVVVTRSNGTKTFGIVEKCNAAVLRSAV
jgi:hypothetical protein